MKKPDMSFNPCEVTGYLVQDMKNLPSTNKAPKTSIMDHLQQFFELTALSIASLKKRMVVEVVVGEMADVMERIGYDSLESRGPSAAQTASWPRKYHVVHLSNVPLVQTADIVGYSEY